MKCVVSADGVFKRVTNDKAARLVRSMQWTYCAKKFWKKEVRDAAKTGSKAEVR